MPIMLAVQVKVLMNDTAREYLSYGKVLLPLLKCRKIIKPEEFRWGSKDQYFLYFSAPAKKTDTLVIYIHGGGWNSNSPKQHFFIGQKIALEGFDCVMPGYRKTPKCRYEEISDDIFKGYSEIKKFLAAKNCKYSKIIVAGSSAGAHLGALLCLDAEKQEKYGIAENEFSGLISMSGPLCFDFAQTGALNILMTQLFNSKNVLVWKKGEPCSKLHSLSGFRMLLIQSEHDGIVGFNQAEAFCKKARALKIPSVLYKVTESWNTHSLYCAGVFLKNRNESATLNRFFEFLEET